MKLRYIDALRGLAIIGVLVVHCGQKGSYEHLPPLVQSTVLKGAFGVQLFYVASAFTLFLSLTHRKGGSTTRWSAFFARRFFRIAPMYYLGICYFLWQDGLGPRYWLGDAPGISAWNVISNFTFLHGFNPYWITSVVPGGWSIAVEMLFYSLIPLLFYRIKNTQQAFVFLLITLFIRASLQFALNRFPLIPDEVLWGHYLYLYLPSQLPVFALGILLFFIVQENYKLPLSPLLFLISSAILMAHLAGIPLLPDHFLFAIAFVLLALALSRFEFKAFVNPVTVFIGKVSYSLYLVHFAVLFWMEHWGFISFLSVNTALEAVLDLMIRLVVVTALSVGIASAFYYLVELPAQQAGIRLMRARAERTTAPSLAGVPDLPAYGGAAVTETGTGPMPVTKSAKG